MTRVLKPTRVQITDPFLGPRNQRPRNVSAGLLFLGGGLLIQLERVGDTLVSLEGFFFSRDPAKERPGAISTQFYPFPALPNCQAPTARISGNIREYPE